MEKIDHNLIDIHCHLNMMERSIEDVLASALQYNIKKVITIGTEPEDLKFVVKTSRQYDNVYGALGIHPHDAKKYSDEVEQYLRDHLVHPKIVAVGEIGLDYHYNHSEPEVQREVFAKTLQIAKDLDLPVQIHTREAEQDTIAILKDFPRVKGIIHCFSGSDWLAQQSLDLGLNLSISGIVTFKKAQSLKDIVAKTPLDRLHIETDAPFLTPAPYRGKTNEPMYVPLTALCVSELHRISPEELAHQVEQNNYRVFPKLLNEASQ